MKRSIFNKLRYDEKIHKANWETEFRTKLALDFIGKNKRVLDIGCFEGYISEKIKEVGNEVIGIELSKPASKICNQRGIKVINQDLEKKLPFNKNSFDVVFAGEIIEHIFDTDSLLQEIRRVLKPNGELVLTTPNIAELMRRVRLLFGKNPSIDIGLISPNSKEKSAGHIRYFTIKSLGELLNRNGFTIEQWKTDFIPIYKLRLVALGKIFPDLSYELIVRAKRK